MQVLHGTRYGSGRRAGIDEPLVDQIPDYENGGFTERERAALAYSDQLVSISPRSLRAWSIACGARSPTPRSSNSLGPYACGSRRGGCSRLWTFLTPVRPRWRAHEPRAGRTPRDRGAPVFGPGSGVG